MTTSQRLTQQEMIDAIVAGVALTGETTMGGIRQLAAILGMNTEGDYRQPWASPNVFIVIAASPEFCALVVALQMSRRLEVHPADVLELMHRGDTIYTLPLARRADPDGYHTPHWLPIKFTVAE